MNARCWLFRNLLLQSFSLVFTTLLQPTVSEDTLGHLILIKLNIHEANIAFLVVFMKVEYQKRIYYSITVTPKNYAIPRFYYEKHSFENMNQFELVALCFNFFLC